MPLRQGKVCLSRKNHPAWQGCQGVREEDDNLPQLKSILLLNQNILIKALI